MDNKNTKNRALENATEDLIGAYVEESVHLEGVHLKLSPEEEEKVNETSQTLPSHTNKTPKRFNPIPYIIKWFVGIYMIGVIVGVNEYLMNKLDPLFTFVMSSKFMSGEFVDWAAVIFGPLRFITSFFLWFSPIVVLVLGYLFAVSKMKFVSKKELKVYSYIVVISLLLFF